MAVVGLRASTGIPDLDDTKVNLAVVEVDRRWTGEDSAGGDTSQSRRREREVGGWRWGGWGEVMIWADEEWRMRWDGTREKRD